MLDPRRRSARFLRGGLLAAALALAACDVLEKDQRMVEGGGIETGNTGALAGRVIDADGNAMRGAEVRLVGMTFSPEGPGGGVLRAVHADSTGRYRFVDVPEGAFSLFSPGFGESPRSALLTRQRYDGTARELPDMISRYRVYLQGRVLLSGLDPAAVHACIAGARLCVNPDAQGFYRFPGAPQGAYEIVFLAERTSHYLAVEVAAVGTDTVSIKDIDLRAAGIPYLFYASTVDRSFSILPVEYPAGAEPAWYKGRDFSGVRYYLLNDGEAAPAQATDPFAAWPYRKTLVGKNAADANEMDAPLIGFPVPVRLTAADFDFSQARPDGSDLVVSDGSGRLLAHEIERWDAAAGKAEIWVRLDTLPARSADRKLTLHWGLPEAVPLAGGPGVFRPEQGYIGVWHLNDRGPGTAAAEARRLHPGNLECLDPADDPALVRAGEGVVAGGARPGLFFSCINVGRQSGLEVGREFTFLVWAKSYHHDAGHDQVLAAKWERNRREWAFTLLADERLEVKFGDVTGWTLGRMVTSDPIDDPDRWHHYGVVFDQGAVRLFVDGRETRTRVSYGSIPDAVNRNGASFNLASDATDKYTNFEGELDEAAYFSAAKSGDWVCAYHRSQRHILTKALAK